MQAIQLVEALSHLMRDGNSIVPNSRYGRDVSECAPVAYRIAKYVASECGASLSYEDLDYAMYLVVNNLDDVANLIDEMDDTEPCEYHAEGVGPCSCDEPL